MHKKLAALAILLVFLFLFSNAVQKVVADGQFTVTVQTQLSSSGEGSQIMISLSQTDTLQLSVAAGQVSGTGSGQGTISVSGSFDGSPASAQFTNTYSVTGTMDENGNASLQITQETTNAPPVITVTITTQTDQGTISMNHGILVIPVTQTNNFRSYVILLQNGYQETVPFPSDYRQIQGQTIITVGGTGPPTRTAGVNQGDWAEYNVSMGAYGGTMPPGFVEVQGGNLSVTGVSGSSVALSILAQYKDGTSDSMAFQIDVNTGEATDGPNFFLIANGLGAGEDENNFKMNGTSIWQYNGQDRPTVYSNSTLGDYLWDQTTGLLIYAKLPQYVEGSMTLDATMTLQLVDTNAFVAITPHTLTIQSSTGGATIPTGTHTQNAGTTLTVTATPNNGYAFANWLLNGANAGSSNPITITFNSDHTLQPVFTQGGQPSNRTVGVNQGDWAQYSVSWQTGTPSSLSDITGVKVTVGEISGTTLTISLTMQFKNGTTTPSSPFTLDVNTGQGGTTTGLDTGVIASKLNQSDLVFTSPQSPLPNAQIADVATWTQNGFNRTAVHSKSDALGEYYWDRDTGILLYAEVPVYSGTSTPTATATLTLTDTNRFSGGSVLGGLPTSLLPLIAGAVAVAIGLIVAAVALRRHRGKKRAPPAETAEPKATLATPPKSVEPGTPAGKKFAFCPECGEKLPDLNAKFCPFCGARLDLPRTNAKTGAETPEAAPKGKAGTTSEAEKKLGPLKNAKTSKHGWKLKIVASLLIIAIAINTVYYFGVFNLTPALRPAQQIMDWIWSAPGLAQVHQAISQAVQGIRNLIPGGSNGSGVTVIKPTQDLTGAWADIPGEGLVVTPLNGPHRFHYDVRMDIVQHGSTFTGTMYISLWNAEALVPYSTWVDDGYWNFSSPGPVQTEEVTNGTISGVIWFNIQFQAIGWTWTGTFTTGLMSGTVQGYSSGVSYSGVFNLRRGGAIPTGIPSAPTGVGATASDGQATISWGAVSGATSYNLYYSTALGVTKATGTKIAGVTSPYTHTGLTNGMTYYYLVTAANSSGESAESAHASATPTTGGGMLQLVGLYPQLYNHYGTSIFVLGNYAYFCEEHVSWTDTYVRILNVATPSAPSLAGSYFVGGVIRAINVADGYMYLGLDNILHEVQTVNIANPAAPSLTAKDTDVSPLDLAVSGSYLYVVGNRALDPPDYIGYDFTSYSLSNKAVPLIVGRYSHPETASDYYREVAVQGNYAYIAANDNGLVVLDISNRAAPSYAGRYSSSVFNGYLKVSVSGNYACVMNMEYDIEILDISNPSSISEVGKYTPGALANDFVLSGQYLYVAEGTNGLKIIDISNPASPVVAGYYKPTGPDPISNAVFVSGQYVYVADGQYGLMIIQFTP